MSSSCPAKQSESGLDTHSWALFRQLSRTVDSAKHPGGQQLTRLVPFFSSPPPCMSLSLVWCLSPSFTKLLCLLFSCDVPRLPGLSFYYFCDFYLGASCGSCLLLTAEGLRVSFHLSLLPARLFFKILIYLACGKKSFHSCKTKMENATVQVRITVNHSE